MARPVSTIQCAACDRPIRRSGSWGACPVCCEADRAHLRQTVGTHDPGAWIVALNRVFGDRERFVEAARTSAA